MRAIFSLYIAPSSFFIRFNFIILAKRSYLLQEAFIGQLGFMKKEPVSRENLDHVKKAIK